MKQTCALIRPRCSGVQWELEEPYGLEAICGYLRAAGIDCQVFDRRLGISVSEIAMHDPDVIGFSLMTEEDVQDTLRLIQRLKKKDRRFLAGGLFVTNETARCRSLFPAETILISGEGEGPILSLLTGRECPVLVPNDWAFASREHCADYLSKGGVIHLRSARGCHGNCAFCTIPGQSYQKHETRSIKLIVNEMLQLASLGYEPIFNFVDDDFGDKERIFELITMLQKSHIRVAFSLELRPTEICKISVQEWEALHAGGLCRIFTGLENLDEDTLRCWHKPNDPNKLLNSIKQCKAAGIACETGYILFHEKTTPESAVSQIQALWQAGVFTPKIALSQLVLYPGSELYAQSDLTQTVLAPLQPNTQILLNEWHEKLDEYYEMWSQCARQLPGAACRYFLSGREDKYIALQHALTRINTVSYSLLNGIVPSLEEKEVLHALYRAALIS